MNRPIVKVSVVLAALLRHICKSESQFTAVLAHPAVLAWLEEAGT
jgi:hypothetical protein